MRKVYGGTRSAIISLPAEAASKILAAGRVKIGWVNCGQRASGQEKTLQVPRLWAHSRSMHQRPHDRLKPFRKCGEDEHIAREYTANPKCMLCEGKEDIDNRHITGSSRCPGFRRALNTKPK